MRGHAWLSWARFGPSLSCVVLCGRLFLLLLVSLWLSSVILGSVCPHGFVVVLLGSSWLFSVLRGCSWLFLVPIGDDWLFLVLLGSSWAFLVMIGPPLVLVSPSGYVAGADWSCLVLLGVLVSCGYHWHSCCSMVGSSWFVLVLSGLRRENIIFCGPGIEYINF